MSTTTKTTKKTTVRKTAVKAAPKKQLVMDRSKSAKPVSTPKKNALTSRPLSARISVPVNQLGVVDQAIVAFERKNLFASLFGVWLGGIVPFGIFMTAHYSVNKSITVSGHQVSGAWLWILVLAGLAYSATTVFKWGTSAFSSKAKSAGFVILLEGILTFSPEHGLAVAALVTMMLINAIATSCNLIAQRKEARQDASAKKKAGK